MEKSKRKNINTAQKKGRTVKTYTMNIERKRLLKQRRERTLQNAKGKGPAEEYFLTALKVVYTNEVDASLFTMDTTTPCDYNISVDMPNLNNSHKNKSNTIPSRGIHSKSKHKYRDVFGDANIQYHDFDNGDALTFTDKYSVFTRITKSLLLFT